MGRLVARQTRLRERRTTEKALLRPSLLIVAASPEATSCCIIDRSRMTNYEKRAHVRIPASLEVRLMLAMGKNEAQTGDISLGGCYIRSTAAVELRTIIDIAIRLPTGHWLPLRGMIVYHNPGVGFGLRFEFSSEIEAEVVARLVDSLHKSSLKKPSAGAARISKRLIEVITLAATRSSPALPLAANSSAG